MGPLSTKQKSCFSCEFSFHAQTEQKPTENKSTIFTTLRDPAQPYVTSSTHPIKQPTIFLPYRRYLPKQDQQTQKHPKITNTHIFVFIIFTLISKKRALFALFSYILSYYVLYLLVPKLFSIVLQFILCTDESFKPYDFYITALKIIVINNFNASSF